MRIFRNRWFTRFASKNGISDEELKALVKILEAGGAEADLGGDVYKQRLARTGEGKSGGYRSIVFFKSGDKTFFAYAFAKSDRANISRKELEALKKQAKTQLAMTNEEIKAALKEGVIKEIKEQQDE
jgi:hypothetical protein